MTWGVDFGNVNCVIAVARRGGIDILANEASSRQTPCLVGFTSKMRVSGEGAAAAWQSNLSNTISEIKQLLGRRWAEPDLQAFKQRVPFEIVEGANGGVAVKVNYDNKECVFTPEQIMAILLKNLMKTAETANNSPSPEAVISVPVFYTDAQRHAMLDAADIAGVRVLRLMNEPAAAALAFGLPKSLEFPDDSAEPQKILFVDMGHHSTTLSVVAFNKSKLQVLATVFDRNLGGKDYDEVLVDQFKKEILQTHKLDLNEYPKAVHRLRLACQKLKVNLSGVPKMAIGIECLANDIDFSSVMEREVYEALCTPLLEKLKALLSQIKGQFSPIASIQLVGSATRMPAVVKTIKEFFEMEPQRALNSEECIAKGCAIAAAMISPTFKVRDFSVVDATAYGINLSWTGQNNAALSDSEAPGNGSKIFTKNNVLPCTKILTFARTEPFEIAASYDPSEIPAGVPTHISHFTISDIVKVPEPRVKAKVRLDLHGILNVEHAWSVEEYEEEEIIAPPPQPAAAATAAAATPTPTTTPAADSTTTPKASSDGETPSGDVDMKEAAPAADAPAAAEQQAPPPQPEVQKKMVKKVRKHECKVRSSPSQSLSPELIKQYKEAEFTMAAHDKWVVETHDKRNELEEYVYNTRDRLSGDLQPFVPEAEKEVFMQKLSDMEDWLYTEECDHAQKGQLQEKLDSLKKLGDPIFNRMREEADRNIAADKLRAAISEFRGLASTTEDKFAHITDEERQKAIAECDEAEKFLNDKLALQSARAKFEDPAFKASDLAMKATILGNTVRPIMNRPKPKVEPKKEADATPKETPTPTSKDASDAAPKENETPKPAEANEPMDTTD